MTDENDTKRKKTAIDAKRGTVFIMSPSDPRLKIVGLDIRSGQSKLDGPEHYLYDARRVPGGTHSIISEERLNNYRYYGVNSAITVVVDGEDLLVDDGRGRLMGARLIEADQIAKGETPLITIKVQTVKGTEEDLFGLSRALNQHDTDDTLTNAKNAARMVRMGGSIGKVAVSFSVSEQTIRNWLDLLTVAPEVLDAVQRNELTPTAAVALSSVPKAEQGAVLADAKAKGGKLTVEKVAALAREKTGKPAANTPKARLEKIEAHLYKLSGQTSPTKDDLLATLDKICRVATGHSFDKLGDIGD